MGELEGDVAAADEQDPAGQRVEVEEVRAVDEKLGARRVERAGPGARRHEEAPRLVAAAVLQLDGVGVEEAGAAVEGLDAGLPEAGLHLVRDPVGEGALVSHEVGPVDGQRALVDALAAHEPGGVDDLGPAAQHLLGVAAPQWAGAAVGPFVDYGDVPSGGRAGPGGGYRRPCRRR